MESTQKPKAPSSNAGQYQNSQPTTQNSSEWVLGMRVRVKTVTDEEYEGQIYTYDPITNCVVLHILLIVECIFYWVHLTLFLNKSLYNLLTLALQCSAKPVESSLLKIFQSTASRYDFRILKISHLKDISYLESNEEKKNEDNQPVVGFANIDKINTRQTQAFRETQANIARIGVGVSQEGQDIFDALSKTLPCHWYKNQIIVLEEVSISPPYDVDNCKPLREQSSSLNRVVRVLEGERRRLGLGK
ncbi:hypothetical protein K7432_011000 [Basidiobolus ranarum]|uniref:AD domain-containing protein n=1 Tax=Basidiobolus ranarum TaxID=34480 RepID=A0ABR2WMZ2_9FUNG